jgi:hypothetical protein
MKHVPDEISTMRCPMSRISSLINSTAPAAGDIEKCERWGPISTCVGRPHTWQREKKLLMSSFSHINSISKLLKSARRERLQFLLGAQKQLREQLCSISKIKEPQSSLCGIKLKIVRALVVYENVCGLLPPIHAPERIFIDPGTYIASQGRSILADTTAFLLLAQLVANFHTKAQIWSFLIHSY